MLTKRDTSLLKGLGILTIVLHNFLHKVAPVFYENEFYFNTQIVENYLISFSNSPIHFFQYFFSYFGHYGVQFFIFLSGYGLMIAYSNKNYSFISFIKKRLLKLYPVFLIAIGMVIVLKYVVLSIPFDTNAALDILYNVTLTSNWIPEKWYALSGPFWFYSMIVQLYIIFYFLVKWVKTNTKALWLVLVLSYVFIFITGSYFEDIKLSLYLNFMGNLPVFVLGMILAKTNFNFNKTSVLLWGLALVVFVLGQFNHYFWYLSQLSIVIVVIPLFLKLKQVVKCNKLSIFLIFTGQLSMYLFAINGVLRAPWFSLLRNTESKWLPYLFLFGHLITIYVIALIVRKMEHYFLDWYAKRIT